MFDQYFSYYANVKQKHKLTDISLKQLIELIATGDKTRELITQIRQTKDKKERNRLKQQLPAVSLSGVFEDRKTLRTYSGLIQIDFDNVENLEALRQQLIKDPYTCVLFVSPSGNGLKVIVQVERDAGKHSQNFDALMLYYLQKYKIEPDPKTKDITRLMYLSFDPNIFTNRKAKVFIAPQPAIQQSVKKPVSRETPSLTKARVEYILEQIEQQELDITADYNKWIAIGFAFADTFDVEVARQLFHRVSRFYPDYDPQQTDRQFDYCYRHRKDHSTIAAFYSIARRYGLKTRPKPAARLDLDSPIPMDYIRENDFGIMIKNRCFYKRMDSKQKRLSNFAMQVLLNIEDDPHNTIKVIKLQRYDWDKAKILFLRSEKLTFYNIKPVLISSSVNFSGTGTDWNNVLEFMLEDEKTVKLLGVDSLGWDGKNGFYVFANAVIDQKGTVIEPDEQGFLEHQGQTFFLPAFSQIEEIISQQNIVDIDFLKNYPFRQGQMDFSQWTYHLIKAYGKKAYIGILFSITAASRDIVFRTTKIPYLYLFGEYNTGKTSFILNFLSLFTTDEGTSLSSSAKAILRTPSQVKNSLVYFKEFDRDIIKDIENPLLSLYDGVTRNIAKKSTNNATHKNKVYSVMIFDGNYMPALRPNLFSRFVILNFEGSYTDENLRHYNILLEVRSQGLGQILAEIISHRLHFEKEFDATFKQVRDNYELFRQPGIDSRIKDHIALFLAVFKTLEKRLDFNFTETQLVEYLAKLMNIQQDSLNSINDLAVFWEAFNYNISTGILLDEYHYKTIHKDGQQYLAIDYNGVYEKYLEYCKNQNLPAADKKTIETLLTSEANPAYIRTHKDKKPPTRYRNRNNALVRSLWFKITDNKIGSFTLYLN